MAAGPGAAPSPPTVRWPEVLARLDYIARRSPPSLPWRKEFLTTFRKQGASKERWAPLFRAMRETGALNEDEEFFCTAVLVTEVARELEAVKDERVVRLEDLLRRLGGDQMAELYLHDRGEFLRRYQRGAQIMTRP